MIPAVAYGQMIGAGVIWFVAIWGRVLGAEPFTTWLYFFAWWPLLLFLDGLLAYLDERDEAMTRGREEAAELVLLERAKRPAGRSPGTRSRPARRTSSYNGSRSWSQAASVTRRLPSRGCRRTARCWR